MRKLPSEVEQTYRVFQSWYYEDSEWTGTWSSREEGHIEDYRQSETPIKLSLSTEQGRVRGEMFNLSVCKLNPLLLPVLVEGEISRGRLLAFAFAYVQGEKRRLYSFQLMRSQEEPVITLTPIQDPGGLLPPAARLVHRVEANGVSEGIRANETVEHPDLECEEDALEFLKRLRSEGHENQQSAERPK